MTTLIAAIRARLDELQAICDGDEMLLPQNLEGVTTTKGKMVHGASIAYLHTRTVTPQFIAMTRRLVDDIHMTTQLSQHAGEKRQAVSSLTIIAEELEVDCD